MRFLIHWLSNRTEPIDLNSHRSGPLLSHQQKAKTAEVKLSSSSDVLGKMTMQKVFFFWLVAAWVKSRAERPSVSGVNRQLHVQIGCKLGIRNRKDELTKQAKRNKLQIKKPGGN